MGQLLPVTGKIDSIKTCPSILIKKIFFLELCLTAEQPVFLAFS
jgi:hypothetical protein